MSRSTSRLAIDGGEPIRSDAWPPQSVVDRADEALLLAALRSAQWSAGPMSGAVEAQFAEFCGVKHCLLLQNGTAAIKIALQAGGVQPGDEVIVSGMTWPSVAVAVLECGAAPIPVDVDLDTLAMSLASVEAVLTPRTRAIVPTHLFSSQADLIPIITLAAARKLQIIEDCSHAPGARRFGRALGTFGQVGVFSFNQKKLLACGEGGCLITDDDDLFENAKSLRQIDPQSHPRTFLPGVHSATEFQAAVLIAQLRKLPTRLALMEDRAEYLRSLLQGIADVFPLTRLPGTDRQTFYNFCFRIAKVPNICWFRRALAAELNLPVAGAYQPLNKVPVLDTTNDPRFKELGKSLNRPLPNCDIAHYQQAARFRHNALVADKSAMDDIARAVEKVLDWIPDFKR